jgi:DNA-binding CsgD family transcriptional regulator
MLTTAAGWLDAVTGDPDAAGDKARTAAGLLDDLNAGRQYLIPLWELRALLGEAPPFDQLPLGDHPAASWSLLMSHPAPRVARRVPVNGLVQRAASLTLAGRWREAIAAWRSVGHPYRLARTLLQAASVARDRATAATLARESAALAERLGARPLAEEAAALLRSGRASANELTDRETEVVRLLAEGKTNKQIAATLTISPKTASVHVTNILGKLGVNTRGDASTVAKRRGLLGP